jgi:hypothetical protein
MNDRDIAFTPMGKNAVMEVYSFEICGSLLHWGVDLDLLRSHKGQKVATPQKPKKRDNKNCVTTSRDGRLAKTAFDVTEFADGFPNSNCAMFVNEKTTNERHIGEGASQDVCLCCFLCIILLRALQRVRQHLRLTANSIVKLASRFFTEICMVAKIYT